MEVSSRKDSTGLLKSLDINLMLFTGEPLKGEKECSDHRVETGLEEGKNEVADSYKVVMRDDQE